jgi:CheY-like chemotaxis protein
VRKAVMKDPQDILLVDDDRQVISYLQGALEQSGYSVTVLTSGHQALASIQASLPDLMILDLNMPKPDGFTC